ncbi:MAG: CoA:oxalate CoA-transferase [Acidimicrobiales bacterium]|jgi:CoA:oxalate CoA-transferase
MRPLDGLRVLDLTRVVAGPMSTRILADQGAEVIKIEPPEGDLSRTFPPIDDSVITPYFAQQNAGKRFCSVDMRAAGATDLLLDLIATCDVVVENFRPGVMAKYGLGPDEMCDRFPALVYCSITGFGQTGPWADRRAYAPIGHLESGLLEYDARQTNRPARQPALVLGDAVTAMMAASSINALLVQAARRGVGGHLDVCMVESLVFMQEWVATELNGGWVGTNNGHCDQTPVMTLPDGRVWGLAGNPVSWFDHLVSVMERPDLTDDPRFADIITREEHREELVAIVAEWAGTFTTFDEFRMVLEAGSPFTVAELRSITELAATDWAAHRGLVTTTDVGIVVPSRPAAGAGIGTTGHVAARGADNREVMRDILGLDDAAIDALVTNGILISS